MSLKEWEEYFNTLPDENLKAIGRGIDTIMTDEQIKKNYQWTGLKTISAMCKVILKYRQDKEAV